jgi:outer membrane receptor protein involved in Fe transport
LRSILLLGAVLVVASPARGADAPIGPIEGRILDAEAAPVPGLVVRIEGEPGYAITDEQGAFVLQRSHAAAGVLLVDGSGIRALRHPVPARQEAPLELVVEWDVESVAPVLVRAERPTAETASTTRLDRTDIAAAPARTAEEVLRQVPGMVLVQHGSEGKGHQFFLRGFDAIHGADLELTLEGMPLNEWSGVHAQGYLDLSLVVPEAIGGVEVHKGPFTLHQGAFAMAGSAAYRLGVEPDDTGLYSAYTFGTTGRHRGVVRYAPTDASGDDVVAVEALDDEGYGEQRAVRRGAVTGRWGLLDRSGHRLEVLGGGQLSRFDLPGAVRDDDVQAGRLGFYDAYDDALRGRSSRALLGLRWRGPPDRHRFELLGWGGYRHLELLENFTGFLVDPERGDRRLQEEGRWSFGAEARHRTAAGPTVDLLSGAGVRGDALEQRDEHVDQAEQPVSTNRRLDTVQVLAHALAGVVWRPTEVVRLDAGARVDALHARVDDRLDPGEGVGQGTRVAVSPRAVLGWTAHPALRVLLAYGRGFRPPESRAFVEDEPARTGLSEERADGGGPEMTVADAVELGARWSPTEALELAASGFGTFIERESVFDHVSGQNLELNGTRRLGAEVRAEVRPRPWLRLAGDLTWTDARFVESGAEVPFAAPLVGGLRAAAQHPAGWSAGLRGLIVGPRPLPHGARGATLFSVDATAGYRWRWLRLRLELENVLNRRLREGELHYASHWRPGEPSSALPVLHTLAGPPFNARLTVGAVF